MTTRDRRLGHHGRRRRKWKMNGSESLNARRQRLDTETFSPAQGGAEKGSNREARRAMRLRSSCRASIIADVVVWERCWDYVFEPFLGTSPGG